jgi:tetratricopeptide (TPR) repeat protein
LESALAAARTAASEGRLDDARETIASVIGRARRYRLRRAQAEAHEISALMYERSGSPEIALEEYERAETLLAEEPAVARVETVTGKARCLQALGDVRYPIFALESLNRLLRAENSDATSRVQVQAALLDVYLDAGLLASADAAGDEIARLLPRVHDDVREGQALMYLARLRATQGKLREADRLLGAAASAYETSALRTETGYAYLARGILQSRQNKLDRAERELQRARRVFEQTHNEKELCNTLIELARVERMSDRTDASAALLDEAIQRLHDGDAQLLAWAHREYGLLYAGRDAALSEKYLRAALDLFDRGDEHVETAATYRMLGDLLRADGQSDAAYEAYATGIERLPAPL